MIPQEAFDQDYSATATRKRLKKLFPRGRFSQQSDGMPILVARSKSLAGCHLYEQGVFVPMLGLYYTTSSRRWLNLLGELVVKHLGGDGEGIIHIRWCPEAAAKLRMFSKKDPGPAVGVASRPYINR